MNEHGDVLADSINMPLSVEDGARLFLAGDSPLYGFDKKIFPGRALQEDDWSVMFVRPEEGESVHTTIARAGKDKGEGGLEFAVQRLKDTDTHKAVPLGGNFIGKIKDELAPVVVVRQGKTYVFPQDKPFQFPGATVNNDPLHMMFDSKHNALIVLAHADQEFPKISKDRQLLNRKPEEESSREIPKKVSPEPITQRPLESGRITIAPQATRKSAEQMSFSGSTIDYEAMWKRSVTAVSGMRYNRKSAIGNGEIILPTFQKGIGYYFPRVVGRTEINFHTMLRDEDVLLMKALQKSFTSMDRFYASQVYAKPDKPLPIMISVFNFQDLQKKEPNWLGWGGEKAMGVKPLDSRSHIVWASDANSKAALFIRGAFSHTVPNFTLIGGPGERSPGVTHEVHEWQLIEFYDVAKAYELFVHLQHTSTLSEDLLSLVVGSAESERNRAGFAPDFQPIFADCTT